MQDSQAPWTAGAKPRRGSLPRGLMQRLLDALRKPARQLAPAGRRSGHGAKSLEPYLAEARKSRPAPLE